MNRFFKFILILLGGALVVWVSLTCWEGKIHSSLVWLNTAVIFVMYLTNAINIFSVFSAHATFKKTMAGIGIHYLFSGCYSLAAIIGMVLGYTQGWEFETQVLYQSVFFLLLLWGYYFSVLAMEQEQGARGQKDKAFAGLQQMKTLTHEVAFALMQKKEAGREREQVQKLEKELDYIAGSVLPAATELEEKYLSEMHQLQNICSASVIDQTAFDRHAEMCVLLLQERKKIFYQ